MFVFKLVLYVLSGGLVFFFGAREYKLRDELTESALQQREMFGLVETGQITEQFKRRGILNSLPPEARAPYKRAVILKFGFLALLIVEVCILQVI